MPRLSLVLVLLLVPACVLADEARLPRVEPHVVGMNAAHLERIDAAVAKGLAEKRMPGCVVLIGRQGKVVFRKAYGDRTIQPAKAPMTVDTLFDMASLTKPVATATSVMLLIERGQIRLRDKVSQHIPEFTQKGKDGITVLHLLTHQGGLIADNSIRDYADGPKTAWEKLFALEPVAEPGERFIYSDVSFMTLGSLVERVSGKSLHEFTQENVFRPMGLKDTGYLPDEDHARRAALTEKRNGEWLPGVVHDPRAYALGGVAGHAGLFSTADDLSVYAQMLLDGGELKVDNTHVRILSRQSVSEMTRPVPVPGGFRALGWDMATGYSVNRGEYLSPMAFGHGGFTGTALWIDPQLELFVIFLSNRVHPDGKGLVNPLAGTIGTIAAAAVEKSDLPIFNEPRLAIVTGPKVAAPTRPAANEDAPAVPVLTGIDILQKEGFAQLKGRKIGLITNHTGINRSGVSTVKLLHDAKATLTLVALFSPEHGFAGKLDVAKIGDARDPETNLPVFSLYGETRTPSAESLQGIDTLVFDIQDIGSRFYTYPSTMGNAMRAAAEHKLRFVVLDRPNPIGGVDVSGPILDAGKESFVGYHRIPVRHGLTIGELAKLFNEELKIGCDLHVIRMENWSRKSFFDRTGLTWINPSPNMRSLTQALIYPGVGLLETTNVSVGRGTDSPFEVVGAPWIEGQRLAGELNAAGLEGVRFVPIQFTPTSSKHEGQPCGGVNVIVTDRREFEPVRTGLEIARQLRLLYPDQWQTVSFNRLLGNDRVHEMTLAAKPVAEIEAAFAKDLQAFKRRREAFLHYK
jgi:uncharacterized protein YbbC (DUF1343 family)/CubicO group peptidase (beta-lactamase class C family)